MLASFIAAMAIQETLYSEPLRPQFHFTAAKGWLNDPNGLVYFKGEYHLFFQHNPFGTQWGNMTWGHAVSKDLVHWKQIENAIEPDALGTIFSGSAVVDRDNTAGFGCNSLICIYTAAGGTNDASKGKPFTQCLAYSADGRHFTKFAGNPVLPHIEAENRDPKVIWYAPTKRWVLALYLNDDRYALFTSPDLKTWTKSCDVPMPGTGECPDFFELPYGKEKRWVFSGANGNYRVGSFDGQTFRPETPPIRTNFGNTGYAAQTYFNDPKGRRIQISWFNNANFPDTTWNQQMGFPTELRLRQTADGPRLTTYPVPEIRNLYAPSDASGGLFDVVARYRVPSAGELKLVVNGETLTYDAGSHMLRLHGKEAKVEPVDGRLELRILADRTSIEVFAQGGLVYMPIFQLPNGNARGFVPGEWKPEHLEVHGLRGAW